MSAQRNDPAVRRRHLQLRISTLKRRVGLASVVGFGALLGLVAEHAVGAHRNATSPAARGGGQTSAAPSRFFDAGGATYSFGDDTAQLPTLGGGQSQSSPQPSPQSSSPPPPVAQTSAS